MKLPRREVMYTLGVIALIAVVVGGIVAYAYLIRPTRLTVAVAPAGSVEEKLIVAFGDSLREAKSDISLTTQSYPDVRDSALALQDGRAQLAIVRPDVELPSNGMTLAILREEALVLAAPKARKINDMEDLAGKKLGLVDARPADRALVERVLARYELSENVTLVPISSQDMPDAVTRKLIDAVAFVASPISTEAGTLMRSFAKASNQEVVVLPVDEAEAIGLHHPSFAQMSIPAGAFGGRPKQPAEAVTTIGVTYRLMAAATLDRGPASILTQHLFRMRTRIARAAVTINQMKAPETDGATSAALPNHPGAVDYFNREQQTFMDRYGDWLWLALFAGGGVTSVFAWVGRFFAQKKREAVDEVLESLGDLLTRARRASTIQDLESLELEVDGLVRDSIRFTTQGLTNTRTMSALMLAIDSTRSAVADRRRVVEESPAASAASATVMPAARLAGRAGGPLA